MNQIRNVAAACLALAGLSLAGTLHAQAANGCPDVAAATGLTWTQLDGPGFTFCKAIRGSDGSEAFAVTLSDQSPFRPRRADRAENALIDGHQVHWYRSEVAARPDALVRETLVEIGKNRVAHISLQAGSADQLADVLKQVEGLQFQPARLSSN